MHPPSVGRVLSLPPVSDKLRPFLLGLRCLGKGPHVIERIRCWRVYLLDQERVSQYDLFPDMGKCP